MDKRWLKEMDMISTRLADLHSVLEALLSRANRGVKDATPEGIISLHEKLHRLQSMAQVGSMHISLTVSSTLKW